MYLNSVIEFTSLEIITKSAYYLAECSVHVTILIYKEKQSWTDKERRAFLTAEIK
jgi:hypothetical protein